MGLYKGRGGGGGVGEALHLKRVVIILRDQVRKRVGISPADLYKTDKNVIYSLNIQIFLLNVCEATRKARALQAASTYKRWEFCVKNNCSLL